MPVKEEAARTARRAVGPVAVDVGVQMAELPEQGALGLGMARVEFPHLGVERVVEEEGTVFGAVGGRDFRIKTASLLGFLTRHKGPADGLGVAEDSGLDGFVFAGSGHGFRVQSLANHESGIR